MIIKTSEKRISLHIFNTQKFVLSRKIHTFANVNHSEKLCGTVIMRYQPNENIIQVLVADDGIGSNKMETIFKFSNIGENLGTRMLGEKVRNELLPLIQNNDKVILDFSGVDVVSNSFADECLAKLLLSMTFEELKQKTTFVSVNDFARKNIAIAFKRRLNQ